MSAKPTIRSVGEKVAKPVALRAAAKTAAKTAANGDAAASAQAVAGAQRKRLRQVELLLEVSRRMAAYDTLTRS